MTSFVFHFSREPPPPASVVWAGLSQQGGCDEGGSAGRFRALAGPGQPGEARGPRPSALPRPASGATAAALGVPDTGHATVRGRLEQLPRNGCGFGLGICPRPGPLAGARGAQRGEGGGYRWKKL